MLLGIMSQADFAGTKKPHQQVSRCEQDFISCRRGLFAACAVSPSAAR
jgi:hypothetical protein